MNIKYPKIIGIIVGAVVAVVWVLFATIYGEVNHAFKDWLAAAFGHHWVAKGNIATLIVLTCGAFGLFTKQLTSQTFTRWILFLFLITLMGIIGLTWFFAAHAF